MLSRTIGLILLVFAAFWSFKSLMPSYTPDATLEDSQFSVDWKTNII